VFTGVRSLAEFYIVIQFTPQFVEIDHHGTGGTGRFVLLHIHIHVHVYMCPYMFENSLVVEGRVVGTRGPEATSTVIYR